MINVFQMGSTKKTIFIDFQANLDKVFSSGTPTSTEFTCNEFDLGISLISKYDLEV